MPRLSLGETFTVVADEPETFLASELLANDAAGPENESGQTLSITNVETSGSGSVSLTAGGDIAYTPDPNFVGVETISYTVTDNGTDRGAAAPLSSVGTITVTVEAPSFARNDTFELDFDSPRATLDVLANDLGAGLVVLSVGPTNRQGTAEVGGDGLNVTYTPYPDFVGTDTFTYTVQNAGGETATATVEVIVDSESPTAVDDDFTVTGDTTLDVLTNDVLGTGATALRVDSVTQPHWRVGGDLVWRLGRRLPAQ